jgi:hypothetical protein
MSLVQIVDGFKYKTENNKYGMQFNGKITELL